MSLRIFLSILLSSLLLMSAPGRAAESAMTLQNPTILVLGDSLSAGYGLDADQGWVHLLKQKLRTGDFPHTVINASISGETTAGGLARLPSLLDRHQPQLVLVELGGNDGLRALPVPQIRQNLERIVDLSADGGATAVLFEMRIPENYGPTYTEAFTRTFTQVSEARGVPLVPFLLAAFATDPAAFQSDGIHPSAAAQAQILDTVWPALEPLLNR
ncbi:arylesterase [Panacagrimonas sp.]|uniref:arylesterase n=1 Tax=Panacagrimonas sp. TaxID=2480088 RepID=UPI003B51AA54